MTGVTEDKHLLISIIKSTYVSTLGISHNRNAHKLLHCVVCRCTLTCAEEFPGSEAVQV